MATSMRSMEKGSRELAFKLAYAFARLEGAERPIDVKVALAELRGMTKGANAVGYGHTDHHVEMVVREFYRDHPIPPFNPTNGSSRIEWENKVLAKLGDELEAIK